jgi:hypothetical protein
MATNPLQDAIEVFSAPIESVIVALGRGLSDAQRALDQNSVQAQQAIDADPVLSQYGVQAAWYQFPHVDLELKLALSVTQESAPATASSPRLAPPLAAVKAPAFRLVAQPVSANYQTQFNYDAKAASTITLSIVPVPPPRAADQAVVTPRMTQAGVQEAALASPAKFATVKDAQGNVVPDPKLRFDVNFNAAARTWFVLQYDPNNPSSASVVVAVDDATGSVRVIST